MKIKEKSKPKKGKMKGNNSVNKHKPKKEKVLVVAQEIKYARLLCNNEKKTRDRVLKALKKWLLACFEKNYEFKEEDFTRVWKGLFYAVWMSDKPLVQEELCENISSILDAFPPEQLKAALLMVKAGFKVLAIEWYGIDHHRMDKFLMLVRRYLRASLRVVHRCGWSESSCESYSNTLAARDGLLAVTSPHYARNATSMILHILDCYLEEIAKVSGGEIPEASLASLLRPIVLLVAHGTGSLAIAARKVITSLLRQSESELALGQKIRAWERMGCPEGGPEALETDDEDESGDEHQQNDSDNDESAVRALDPRAGRVDAEVPLLAVPASELARLLRAQVPLVSGKPNKRVHICLQRLERLSQGLPAFELPSPPSTDDTKIKLKHNAKNMVKFEQKLIEDADELRLRGLSRKHRKRLLKKARSGLSIVEDVQDIPQNDTKPDGDWKIEALDDLKDSSDKENEGKSKKDKESNKRKSGEDSPIAPKKQKTDKKDKFNRKDKKKDKVLQKHENEKTNEKSSLKEAKIHKKDKLNNKLSKGEIKANILDNKETKVKDKKKQKETDVKKVILSNGITENTVNAKEKLKKQEKTKIDMTKKDSVKVKELKKDSIKDKVPQKDRKDQKKDTQEQKQPKDTKKSYSFDINNLKNGSISAKRMKPVYQTPKKVKFVLKNNSMQKPIDYYKSVRQSPSIPYDSSKKPNKTNLKVCTPSPINPFFKKKLKLSKLG